MTRDISEYKDKGSIAVNIDKGGEGLTIRLYNANDIELLVEENKKQSHEIVLLNETLNYCKAAFEEIGVSEKDRGTALYKAYEHVECSSRRINDIVNKAANEIEGDE